MIPCQHNPPNLPPPGQPYDTRYCRLCWLYEHDPGYRALWDLWQPVPTASPGPPRSPPCRHRGAALREEPCPSCHGQVRVKVFVCALHRECTVARPIEGCACCGTCPDYVPAAEDQGPPAQSPRTAPLS